MKYSSLIELLVLQSVTVVKVLKEDGQTNYRHHLIVSDMQHSNSSCIESRKAAMISPSDSDQALCKAFFIAEAKI